MPNSEQDCPPAWKAERLETIKKLAERKRARKYAKELLQALAHEKVGLELRD